MSLSKLIYLPIVAGIRCTALNISVGKKFDRLTEGFVEKRLPWGREEQEVFEAEGKKMGTRPGVI